MKKKLKLMIYIYILLLLVPLTVNALEGNILLDCDKEILDVNEEANCYISGNYVDEVSSFHGELSTNNNLTITQISKDNIWEGAVDNGEIDLYTDVNKKANFNLVTFKIKALSNGTGTITLNNIKVSDASFDEFSIDNNILNIRINKQNTETLKATCPTISNYSGPYDGSNHTITVTGGLNGITEYSLDNNSWSTIKPQRNNVGTLNIHIRMKGTGNYETVNCNDGTITITKVDATCPTINNYSGPYDGNSHTITVTNGIGGTIKYSTDDGENWSETKPSKKDVSRTVIDVKIEGDSNHNTKLCGTALITITEKNDSPADIKCPSLIGYSGEFDNKNHTITTTGETNGIVEYSLDNSTWTNTVPKRKDIGESIVYVRVKNNSEQTIDCGFTSIVIVNQSKENTTNPTTNPNGNKSDDIKENPKTSTNEYIVVIISLLAVSLFALTLLKRTETNN